MMMSSLLKSYDDNTQVMVGTVDFFLYVLLLRTKVSSDIE